MMKTDANTPPKLTRTTGDCASMSVIPGYESAQNAVTNSVNLKGLTFVVGVTGSGFRTLARELAQKASPNHMIITHATGERTPSAEELLSKGASLIAFTELESAQMAALAFEVCKKGVAVLVAAQGTSIKDAFYSLERILRAPIPIDVPISTIQIAPCNIITAGGRPDDMQATIKAPPAQGARMRP